MPDVVPKHLPSPLRDPPDVDDCPDAPKTPFVVVEADETTSTGHSLEAFRVKGPDFLSMVRFGGSGQEGLKRLARRMNFAYWLGRRHERTAQRKRQRRQKSV